MNKFSKALIGLILTGCASARTPALQGPLAFDHVLIFVSPGAPERAVLEQAGFLVEPNVNDHEGQGTASITIEFENAFLELVWRDANVPVHPELQRGAERFARRAAWRTTGQAPFAFSLRRIADTALPFPTWSVAPAWLPPGKAIEILTPRDDPRSPSLSITPTPGDSRPAPHPIGVRRITLVRLITPRDYDPVTALNYVRDTGAIAVDRGDDWLVELTFDSAVRGRTRDFRPTLPLRIYW